MAHEGSDRDYYEVVRDNPTVKTRYSRQSIRDGVDTNVVDLSTFLHFVEIGVPQACEALFSQKADVDLISDMRSSYRLTSSSWDRYLRTALNFIGSSGDFKRLRHGVRLALNLRTIRTTGRFDPTLTPGEVERISMIARLIEVGFIEPTSVVHTISGIGR
jgi:hypothetical protein